MKIHIYKVRVPSLYRMHMLCLYTVSYVSLDIHTQPNQHHPNKAASPSADPLLASHESCHDVLMCYEAATH